MYIPTYFKVPELFPPEVIDDFRKDDISIWGLMDENLLMLLDELRRSYGKMIINTSDFHYRGFRPASCNVGAKYSQHRFGRAADIIFTKYKTSLIIRQVLANPHYFEKIKAIEKDVEWFHVDVRNCTPILMFR